MYLKTYLVTIIVAFGFSSHLFAANKASEITIYGPSASTKAIEFVSESEDICVQVTTMDYDDSEDCIKILELSQFQPHFKMLPILDSLDQPIFKRQFLFRDKKENFFSREKTVAIDQLKILVEVRVRSGAYTVGMSSLLAGHGIPVSHCNDKLKGTLDCKFVFRAWVDQKDMVVEAGEDQTKYYYTQYENFKKFPHKHRLDDHRGRDVYYKLKPQKLDAQTLEMKKLPFYDFSRFDETRPSLKDAALWLAPNLISRIEPLLDDQGRLVFYDMSFQNKATQIRTYQKVRVAYVNPEDSACLAVKNGVEKDLEIGLKPLPATINYIKSNLDPKLRGCIIDKELWVRWNQLEEIRNEESKKVGTFIDEFKMLRDKRYLYGSKLSERAEQLSQSLKKYFDGSYSQGHKERIYELTHKNQEELETYIKCNTPLIKNVKLYMEKYKSWIEIAASNFGLPIIPTTCIFLKESHFEAKATSHTGAAGLTQLTDGHIAYLRQVFVTGQKFDREAKKAKTLFDEINPNILKLESEVRAIEAELDRIEKIEVAKKEESLKALTSQLSKKARKLKFYKRKVEVALHWIKTNQYYYPMYQRLVSSWNQMTEGVSKKDLKKYFLNTRTLRARHVNDRNLKKYPALSIVMGSLSLAVNKMKIERSFDIKAMRPDTLWIYNMFSHNSGFGGLLALCGDITEELECLQILQDEVASPTERSRYWKKLNSREAKRRNEVHGYLLALMNCMQIDFYGQEAKRDRTTPLYYVNKKNKKVRVDGFYDYVPFSLDLSERTDVNKCHYQRRFN